MNHASTINEIFAVAFFFSGFRFPFSLAWRKFCNYSVAIGMFKKFSFIICLFSLYCIAAIGLCWINL